MAQLTKVFEPGMIGNMEVRNRLVKSGEVAYSADEMGHVTDTLAGYYIERAKGGVGVVTVGVCSAFLDAPLGRFFPAIFDDSYIPGHRRMVEGIHKYGACANLQIGHHGASIARRLAQLTNFKVDLVAPSNMIFPGATVPAREMNRADIAHVVEGFASAALRAKEAGYDSVEIHASGFALVNQFRSPYFNKRSDEYGGSVRNRARFACEVIQGIRDEVGHDMAIIMKLNSNDMIDGGLTLDETLVHAPMFAAAGVDALLVSAGINMMSPNGGLGKFHELPRGCLVPDAAAIKKVAGNIAIIAGSRIDIQTAEEVISSGKADFCTMCRPLIADPYLPNKAKDGRLSDVRVCNYCGECAWSDNADYRESLKGRGLSCSINPCLGSESDPAFEIKPAKSPRQVMVVGGGIAGMEAAWTLAERGHQVTLYEKSDQLGGQWRIASHLKSRRSYLNSVNTMRRDMRRTGVKVVLNQEVSAELASTVRPDVAVIATGAVPAPMNVPGATLPHVVFAEDVLLEKAKLGNRVVVVAGLNPGIELAYTLVSKCQRLALVLLNETPRWLDRTTYYALRNKLADLGVPVYANSTVLDIQPSGIRIQHNLEPLFLKADTIVQGTAAEPVNGLMTALSGIVPEVYVIGDAAQVRHAPAAIREGAELGRRL